MKWHNFPLQTKYCSLSTVILCFFLSLGCQGYNGQKQKHKYTYGLYGQKIRRRKKSNATQLWVLFTNVYLKNKTWILLVKHISTIMNSNIISKEYKTCILDYLVLLQTNISSQIVMLFIKCLSNNPAYWIHWIP